MTSAAVVGLPLVLVLLGGCVGPGAGAAPDSATSATTTVDALTRRAAAAAATLAGLPGVEEATPGPVADGSADARWVSFDVRTDVATAPEVTATASAALAVLVADDLTGSVRLAQPARPGLPAVAVTLGTDVPAEALLATTAQVLALPGVTGAEVAEGTVSLGLDGPATLPALAGATAALDTATLMMATPDQRLSTVTAPGLLTPALAGALAAVLARHDVTSVFFGGVDGPDEALQVRVRSASAQAAVAQALAATDDGPVRFAVATAFQEVTGTVGQPLAAGALDAPPPAPTTWPADPAAPACTGADLEVRVEGGDAALGRRFLLLAARNAGPVACAVDGTPAVEFWRASGTTAPDVEVGTRPGTPAPGRVVVPADGTVYAQLQWGAMSTALDPDVTVALGVRAVRGAEATRLAVPANAGGPLDVLAGAAVAIGPWQQTAGGWQVAGGSPAG